MTKEENENEEEAIERRILNAHFDKKINKILYYEMEGIEGVLKALTDGKISKKLYFELLGCQENKQ